MRLLPAPPAVSRSILELTVYHLIRLVIFGLPVRVLALSAAPNGQPW